MLACSLCAVDVSVVHPTIPSAPSAEAALLAESRKQQRYQEQCSLVGVKLVPFIVTTYSSLGREALKLVRWVGKLLEEVLEKQMALFSFNRAVSVSRSL